MRISMQQAADMLLKNDNILILAHASPDGYFRFKLCTLSGFANSGEKMRVSMSGRDSCCYRFIVDDVGDGI